MLRAVQRLYGEIPYEATAGKEGLSRHNGLEPGLIIGPFSLMLRSGMFSNTLPVNTDKVASVFLTQVRRNGIRKTWDRRLKGSRSLNLTCRDAGIGCTLCN
jgi:hypothetical protein